MSPQPSTPTRFVSRSRQRIVHLLFATVLGVYLYSPLGSVAGVEPFVQVVAFPALALSGLLMWRGPRLRRRFLGGERA
jgi:hypothetical protein